MAIHQLVLLLLPLLATGAPYYQKDDMTCYHMVLQSLSGGYERELLPYASEVYSVQLIPDGHFADSNFCKLGSSYGTDGSYLWVDKGCKGRFMVCYKLGDNVLVLCSAHDSEYHTCSLHSQIVRIEFVKYLTNSSVCHEDETYGYKDNYVWVKNGCRVVLRVTIPNIPSGSY